MSQFPPQDQQYPSDQEQFSQQLPPPQSAEAWQQPNMSYQSAPQYPGQQQPMQQGMYPPSQPPKKKSRRALWITLGAVAAVLLALCVGVSSLVSNVAKTTTSTIDTTLTSVATSVATTAPSTQHFKMGQVVNVGSINDLTVNSAKIDKGGAYNTTQKAGDVFLVFNITVKNISQQEQSISSLVQFNLTDSTGQKYDAGFDTTAGASLDGKVEPGSLLRGSVVYEVPSNIKSFVLSFQTDLFTSGQTEWDIQV